MNCWRFAKARRRRKHDAVNIRDHKSRVAALKCLVCGANAELHHPRAGQGMAQRASDWLCVPLCPEHHRGSKGWHGDRATFRMMNKEFQSEMDMIAEVIRRLIGETR